MIEDPVVTPVIDQSATPLTMLAAVYELLIMPSVLAVAYRVPAPTTTPLTS